MSDIAALVADNLDIWTGAIERKSGAGRGGGGKRISLYGIERLRALILDLAVRGKLVPQDAGDEPAGELLKRIDKARPKLVEAGFIARSKAAVERTSPEAPFPIPATWAWVRLERLGAIVGGGTPSSTDKACFMESGHGTPWLTPADLSGFAARYIERGQRDLAEKGLASSSAKVMPKGTVLFTSRAPIGYVAIAANPISTNQGFKSVVPSIDGMSDYIAITLKTFAEEIDANAPGTTFKEVSGKIVSAIAFPLPPLAEQRRIVAKVDELMALCDALERESVEAMAAHEALVDTLLATLVNSADAADVAANWARLENHFDTLFTTEASIEALKQTILALAVRGKLVKQDAGDDPAENLLAKIRNARTTVIKTAKRDSSPENGENTRNLRFPSGWKVTTLNEIFEDIHYGYTASADHSLSDIRLLRITDIQNGLVDWETVPGCEISEKQASKYLIREGDIMIARTGGTIGKTYFAKNVSVRAVFASYLIRAKSFFPEVSPYLQIYFGSDIYWRQLYANSAGTGQPNVNATALKSLAVPFPPLAEQYRIVAKVDELMALCDALKSRLVNAAETRRHLADAVVDRAAA